MCLMLKQKMLNTSKFNRYIFLITFARFYIRSIDLASKVQHAQGEKCCGSGRSIS